MQKCTKKFFVCMLKSIFLFIHYFYLKYSVCCHFEKINEKKPWENKKNIYRYYCILNIKLKIMLYEPLMLNIVWKSERFGNLSLQSFHSPWKRIAFLNGKCIGTLSKWTVSCTFKNLTWEVFTWLNCTATLRLSLNILCLEKMLMYMEIYVLWNNVLYDPCRC